MRFIAVEEIAAPRDRIWPHVTDFGTFEDRAAQRIGPVLRTPPGPPAPGTTWRARVEFLGTARDLTTTLTSLDRPSRIEIAAAIDGIDLALLLELEEKSPRLARLTVVTEAAARTLGGRVLLHSAKLARQTLLDRYRARVTAFAAMVEEEAATG